MRRVNFVLMAREAALAFGWSSVYDSAIRLAGKISGDKYA
jgi:hypothetical protein